MTIAWMMYALGVGVLLTIAAVCAEWALKSAQQSVRFVWVAAIALTLVFTILAPLRAPKPQPTIILPAITMTDAQPTPVLQPTLFEKVMSESRAALNVLVLPARRSMALAKSLPQTANVGAGAFWLLSAAVALLTLLTVYTRSMRESLRWPRMRVLGRTVRVAPDVGPAVMGMAPPEIVIPRWVLKRNTEEQRLVLEHEGEHVRAHDPLLLVFACLSVALMPWNAAVWFMWSRLRLAVELDCDRRVLSRGVAKPAYGELLVELSSQRPWNSLAMPAFSWGTSHLEKRLVAMTARPVRFSVARRVASGGVIAVVLVAACQSEMPTAAQVAAMDVSALAARVPLTDSTIYFVNDRQVSKAEAKAIAAEDISSVEVQRASKNSPIAKVHVNLANDSTRRMRIASRADSARKGQARAANQEAVDATRSVTLQGDSVTIRISPQRDLSLIAPDKAAAMKVEGSATTNGNALTLVTDSSEAELSGKRLVLRAPTCGPELVANATATGTFRGQTSNSQLQAPPCPGAPLFIIDGVIVESSAAPKNIDPNSIERIEVIKGKAANSLYGPRAANGVILITSKK